MGGGPDATTPGVAVPCASMSGADQHQSSLWAPLTPAERRVAVLTSQGLRNVELPRTLFLSPKTIEKHLGQIYRKLGLRSRTELARLVLIRGGELE
jgi:DNA-binding CsgD family transcriptional regulator